MVVDRRSFFSVLAAAFSAAPALPTVASRTVAPARQPLPVKPEPPIVVMPEVISVQGPQMSRDYVAYIDYYGVQNKIPALFSASVSVQFAGDPAKGVLDSFLSQTECRFVVPLHDGSLEFDGIIMSFNATADFSVPARGMFEVDIDITSPWVTIDGKKIDLRAQEAHDRL